MNTRFNTTFAIASTILAASAVAGHGGLGIQPVWVGQGRPTEPPPQIGTPRDRDATTPTGEAQPSGQGWPQGILVQNDQNAGAGQPPAPAGWCNVVAIGEPGEPPPFRPRSGQLSINASFAAIVTTAQRAVIQQAIQEWQNIILDNGAMPNPYPISFTFADFGPASTLLANTTTHYFSASGNLISADMSFNTRYTFFVDPTPADDSEFNGGSPPVNYDLLTVARHELGHAIGYFANPYRVMNQVSNGAFAGPRLNILFTTDGGGHTDPAWLPNDLMVPSIGTSTRRPISLYPAASLPALAYGYVIPMRFVDAAYFGIQTGNANQPFNTIPLAMAAAPPGVPLLLSNATHHVAPNQLLTTPRTVNPARGGSLVTAP